MNSTYRVVYLFNPESPATEYFGEVVELFSCKESVLEFVQQCKQNGDIVLKVDEYCLRRTISFCRNQCEVMGLLRTI